MNAYLYSQMIKLLYETYFDTKVRKHKPKLHFSKKRDKFKMKKRNKTKKTKKIKKNKKKIKKNKKNKTESGKLKKK